jgi:hypothetical protein
MSEFGTCQRKTCEQAAVVGLNGLFLCQAHFEDALKKAKAVVDRMMEGLRP